MHMAYVFYIYLFGFILPVVIIFNCYLKIIRTIKFKVKYGEGSLLMMSDNETFQNIRRTSSSSPGLQGRVNKDRKLTIMVAVMVSSQHYLFIS